MESRVEEIREQIREIKRSWPAHTPSPAMLQRLEELEDELHQLLGKEQQAAESDRG